MQSRRAAQAQGQLGEAIGLPHWEGGGDCQAGGGQSPGPESLSGMKTSQKRLLPRP